MTHKINYESKITNLWMLIFMGLLLHSFMYLLPLFYGESVAISNPRENGLTSLTWMILICNLLPMLMIFLLQLSEKTYMRWFNFYFSLPFLLLNLGHPFENMNIDPVPWDQVILQLFLAMTSIALTIFSYQWAKEKPVFNINNEQQLDSYN
ncbi:MAG: hypothetical protein KUG72_08955 [Pseudomonadales bacterium]|nr:hypothetical protein [Pseudomonadales bacterium]